MQRFSFFRDFKEFLSFLGNYIYKRSYRYFRHFEKGKDFIVDGLYQKRGKYAQPFVHSGMMGLLFVGVTFGPLILSETASADELSEGTLPSSVVLGTSTDPNYLQQISTQSSQGVIEYRGGEILEYQVQEGDTIGSIAEKYNLQLDTILWANDLTEKSAIKPDQIIKVPPVDGIVHTVRKGDTIYSLAKRYGLGDDPAAAQGILNYPFNTFTDDETFGLAIGQIVVIPDGAKPEPGIAAPTTRFASRPTPDAGTVSAAGSFIWPASGGISQRFAGYHPAIDISNRSGGSILAADSGTVIVAGWPDNYGYGNRVIIDHGNGFVTLYAHLSGFSVSAGQTVTRGNVIGNMGCTGRCTGTHLHFEIRSGGVVQNPLSYLQ